MAKIRLPLLSQEASGQIGKSLVYFNWKGLNVVRSYAVPSNPRTQAQLTQRGYFSQAVDAWHSANFSEEDRSAWNLLATISKIVMSGFNAFLKFYVEAKVSDKSFTPLKNVTISNISSSGATVSANISADKSSKLYWGTSKTFMPNVVSGTFSDGTVTFTLSNLPSNSYIYFYIVNTSTNELGRTGIYYFKTLT